MSNKYLSKNKRTGMFDLCIPAKKSKGKILKKEIRRSLGRTTKVEEARVLRDRELRKLGLSVVGANKPDRVIKDFETEARKYIAARKRLVGHGKGRLSKTTVEKEGRMIESILIPFFRKVRNNLNSTPLPILEIDHDTVYEFVEYRNGQNTAKRTGDKNLQTIKNICLFAQVPGWSFPPQRLPGIGLNCNLVFDNEGLSGDDISFFKNQDEVVRFFCELHKSYVDYAKLGYYQGWRMSNYYYLSTDQIDIGKMTFFLPGYQMKGGKAIAKHFAPEVHDLVRRLYKNADPNTRRLFYKEIVNTETGELVERKYPSFQSQFNRAFKNACKRMGIKDWKSFHPHCLRHSISVHKLAAGATVREVQLFLGHKNSKVTEDVYLKFVPEYEKAMLERTQLKL